MTHQPVQIKPAQGKLGVLLVGLGAVSTTFVAGVEAAKKGIRPAIGSLTQIGHIRLGKRTDNRNPKVKDFVPLTKIEDLVYGAWDLFPDNGYEAACKAHEVEVGRRGRNVMSAGDLLSRRAKSLQIGQPQVVDPRHVHLFLVVLRLHPGVHGDEV